jgi:hypothetical protein
VDTSTPALRSGGQSPLSGTSFVRQVESGHAVAGH